MPTRVRIPSASAPRSSIATAAALALAGLLAPAARADFQGLGPITADTYTAAHAISGDGGTVVGTTIDENNDVRSFRWTATGGMQLLPPINPEWTSGDAYAVSHDGSVIVGEDYNLGSEDGGTRQGYRWTAGAIPTDAGTTQGLPYVDPDYSYASARGVSADGSVVVGWEGGYIRAFRWTAETGTVLLGGEGSEANAVSADGAVVAGTASGDAFRWTAADGLKSLARPDGADGSEAFGISADGSTIVGTYSTTDENWVTTEHAVAWTEAGPVTLQDIPCEYSTTSHAHAVSADGIWAVGHSGESGSEVATLWDTRTGQVWDLNVLLTQIFGEQMLGWSLQFATGISADGRIITGHGINPLGGYGSWVADLSAIPEPASCATLASLGALSLIALRRKRRRG